MLEASWLEASLPAAPPAGDPQGKPGGGRSSGGQGLEADTAVKRAVEQHALQRARQYFEALGYAVEDHSAQASYDLLAVKPGERVWVEVKGTRGDGSSVLLTANEVEHARLHYPQVVLVVVKGIEVRKAPEPEVRGGEIVPYWRWDVDAHPRTPTAFRCALNRSMAMSITPEESKHLPGSSATT